MRKSTTSHRQALPALACCFRDSARHDGDDDDEEDEEDDDDSDSAVDVAGNEMTTTLIIVALIVLLILDGDETHCNDIGGVDGHSTWSRKLFRKG